MWREQLGWQLGFGRAWAGVSRETGAGPGAGVAAEDWNHVGWLAARDTGLGSRAGGAQEGLDSRAGLAWRLGSDGPGLAVGITPDLGCGREEKEKEKKGKRRGGKKEK